MKCKILPFGEDGPKLSKKDVVTRDFTAARIFDEMLNEITESAGAAIRRAMDFCGLELEDGEKITIVLSDSKKSKSISK
jgi:hypothetical protein